MTGTPFLLGPDERAALQGLRELAVTKPVEMRGLLERLKRPKIKAAHMAQMTRQTVVLPLGWTVTLSLEVGHPAGTCRHMSMASPDRSRVPLPEAVWIVAEELGFVGGLELCTVWLEDLTQGKAVNVVQPVTVVTADGASS